MTIRLLFPTAILLTLTTACDDGNRCVEAKCSSDFPDAAGSADARLADAPPNGAPDARPSGQAVDQIDCAGLTPVATISFDATGPTPATLNVRVGNVVKVEAGAEHALWENNGAWQIGGTSCLRFNVAASYESNCYFHGNEARSTIVVAP